jgi:hypothetical protein
MTPYSIGAANDSRHHCQCLRWVAVIPAAILPDSSCTPVDWLAVARVDLSIAEDAV